MSEEESKLDRHIRLARKHISEIEKMGYVVGVGHDKLEVSDYSSAPPESERSPHSFDPQEYTIRIIW